MLIHQIFKAKKAEKIKKTETRKNNRLFFLMVLKVASIDTILLHKRRAITILSSMKRSIDTFFFYRRANVFLLFFCWLLFSSSFVLLFLNMKEWCMENSISSWTSVLWIFGAPVWRRLGAGRGSRYKKLNGMGKLAASEALFPLFDLLFLPVTVVLFELVVSGAALRLALDSLISPLRPMIRFRFQQPHCSQPPNRPASSCNSLPTIIFFFALFATL